MELKQVKNRPRKMSDFLFKTRYAVRVYTKYFIPTIPKLMANGVAMEIGRSAQLNVAVEPKYGVESVPALLQLMVERSVREMPKKVKSATSNRVQETETGLAGVIGQSAQLNVVEELNLGAGPVTTHPQLMEVQTVRGTLRKLDPVTPTLV